MSGPIHPTPYQLAMPGPDDTTRVVLDNGLILLVRENHAAPVVVIDGYVPAGAIHDPHGKTGAASFVASMLTRGSASYSFDDINEQVESVGASLSISADDHTTSFSATSLGEDFPAMLQIMADLLRRPTFPADYVERVRKQKLVRIQERDEDTQEVAGMAFAAALFGDHPYGRTVLGDAQSVAAIRRDDLFELHAATYTPQSSILVIVGDVETPRVVDLVQRLFGDWQGPAANQFVPPLAPLTGPQQRHIVVPGKVQADLIVGNRAAARHHPDFFPLRVANTILGRFGMMGRLGDVVREELGLAYYATSSHDTGPVSGSWYALAGVNPVHVEPALAAIRDEFARLAAEPVAAEELADTQAYLTGIVPLQLETNDGVAATLLTIEWYGLGLDYLYRYADLVNGVGVADVQRVARTYLDPATAVTVVAGPPAAAS